MPESGPYGPLPWLHPRPWSLWAYVALYAVALIYYAIFIWEGGPNALAWVFPLIVLYFLWRGSKMAWGVSIVFAAIGMLGSGREIRMAREPGGHEPIMHVIEAALFLAMLMLLLLRPTRRFYDLGARQQST